MYSSALIFAIFASWDRSFFKVAEFSLSLYMLYWLETKAANLKSVYLPDKLKSLKLFTSTKIIVSRVSNLIHGI